jgi:outer membrane protein
MPETTPQQDARFAGSQPVPIVIATCKLVARRSPARRRFRPGTMCRRPARGRVALITALLVATFGSGCRTQTRIALEDSVRLSRDQAFRDWQASRKQTADRLALLSGALTLQDAVNLALLHNRALLAVVQEKEVARGRVLESYSAVLPSVSLTGNYTRLDEPSSFDVGGQSITLGFQDNYSVGLEVRQPVFRGGAIPAALRAGQLFALLSNEEVRAAVQGTIFAVARDYLEARLAGHLFAVNEDAVTTARAHLADVQKRHGEGMATDYDVLRAQVDVSNFEAEMIQQRNRMDLAKARLLKTLGVSQESTVEIADPLTFEPVRPAFAAAMRFAHANRPDLRAAELGLRLQSEALRIARSRYWPQVDAVLTQNWAKPDPHSSTVNDWGDAWVAGLSVEIPIFDGLRREGRIVQEKATLQQRRFELEDAEQQALLDVQQAVLNLRDAEEFVESQRLNLERAREALRLVETGYREGVNTEVEITDARTALTRARGLHYQAIYSHAMARLGLQRAMGILGPVAGDADIPKPYKQVPGHIEVFDEGQEHAAPGPTLERIEKRQP